MKEYAFPIMTGKGKNSKRIGWFNLDNRLADEKIPAVEEKLLSLIEQGVATFVPVSSNEGDTYLTIQVATVPLAWFQPESDETPGEVYALLNSNKARVERFKLAADINSVLDDLFADSPF